MEQDLSFVSLGHFWKRGEIQVVVVVYVAAVVGDAETHHSESEVMQMGSDD